MATTLIDVPVGSSATITGADVDVALGRRLRELGLRRGADVTVVQKATGGGRVVKIRDTHYALGAKALKQITCELARGCAHKANVEYCANCPNQPR